MPDDARARIAHLYRRAGFGARTAELNTGVARGYAATVEGLVSPPKQQSGLIKQVGSGDTGFRDAQTTWVQAMATSTTPLVERMTLFLANHFATSYVPSLNVDAPALVAQQAKFRAHALGSFATLAHAMVDDLALGCYLSNDRNSLRRPNENLGREIMELFLLGTGNYTEADVKEASRALTGYYLRPGAFGAPPTFVYDAARHDNGPKTILGVTAAFTPHSLVDHLLKQPAAKVFLATKLVRHFVSLDADPALVTAVANALANWQLGTAMRTLLLAPQFSAPAARYALPKSPAEYVVGIVRALRRTEFAEAARFMADAGQALYAPPSVAGWTSGVAMLGPGNMLARYNAAARLAQFHSTNPATGAPTATTLGPWIEEFGLTELSPTSLAAIGEHANATSSQTTAIRIAGMLTLLATTPEFHLS